MLLNLSGFEIYSFKHKSSKTYHLLSIFLPDKYRIFINKKVYYGSVEIKLPYFTYIIEVEEKIVLDNNTRLLFKKWNDNITNSTRILLLNKDYVLKPIYVRQYFVSVVGGSGSGWYDAGSTITVSVVERFSGFPFNWVFDCWVDEHSNVFSRKFYC